MSAMSADSRQATLTESWEAPEPDESAPEPEEEPEYLPCGHDAIWRQDGDCMACEPAFMTGDEREARDELRLTRQPGDYE